MNTLQTIVTNELPIRKANLANYQGRLKVSQNELDACLIAIQNSALVIESADDAMPGMVSAGAREYLDLTIKMAQNTIEQNESLSHKLKAQIESRRKEIADMEQIITDLEGLLTPDVASVL